MRPRVRLRSANAAAPLVLVSVLVGLAFLGGYVTALRSPNALAWAGLGGVPSSGRPPGGFRAAPVPPNAVPPDDLGDQLDAFWEAWNFVEREYYRRPVDRARLVQGAIKGMLGTLEDPQAAYLDRQATRLEKTSLDGVLEGIGASLDVKERRLLIVAPVEDGPAARAGMKTGDVLLKVDGRDLASVSVAEATTLIRGPAGTKVRLTVVRLDDPEGQLVEIELTRARIELETVSSKMAAEGVGYVRIRLFGTQTVPQLTRALRDLRARRIRGLIVDLRDNPGGYMSGAIDVASQFLKEGSVVVFEERDGERRPATARSGGLATDLTLAVLVNRGSASASEIVAGALRDHQRAVLIGEHTFGKGTVQLPMELTDGSSVRITVATWLTPGGKQIQGYGLTPTIEVKPTAEDEKARRDPVLERALDWFKVAPTAAPGAPPGSETPAASEAPASAATSASAPSTH